MTHSVDKRPVIILVIVPLVTFICHVTTVKYYPLAWLDEVDIIEIARFSTYDQQTEWSMILSPTAPVSTAAPFIHYLGGFVNQLRRIRQ
jgi:hypothetical protein